MSLHRALKESVLAVGLLAFGLIGLPALIFLLGPLILGEYGAGIENLYSAIGDALVDGNPFAWFLIFSPYIGIQLIRFGLWLHRRRRVAS